MTLSDKVEPSYDVILFLLHTQPHFLSDDITSCQVLSLITEAGQM